MNTEEVQKLTLTIAMINGHRPEELKDSINCAVCEAPLFFLGKLESIFWPPFAQCKVGILKQYRDEYGGLCEEFNRSLK